VSRQPRIALKILVKKFQEKNQLSDFSENKWKELNSSGTNMDWINWLRTGSCRGSYVLRKTHSRPLKQGESFDHLITLRILKDPVPWNSRELFA
jgi:hypothetical protein